MSVVLPSLRPPAGPISGRWSAGVGDAVAAVARVPDPMSDLLRLLNHFGGVAISADDVEFDGDSVDWFDVTSVETHSLLGYLIADALSSQVSKLPLPPIPGRGLLLKVVTTAALTALVAAAGGARGRVFNARIPAEVTYTGILRTRKLTPGVVATLLLADPGVRDAMIQTAEAHGITVRRADADAVDNADKRLRRLKAAWERLTR